MNQKIKDIFIYLGLFLLFFGLAYTLFDRLLPASQAVKRQTNDNIATPTTSPDGVITFEGPKTEICPINGELHTRQEKEIWQQRRPLLVMIENHTDSRPQSGLTNADIIYEAVAEGGITRLMAVYYCNALRGASQKYDLGPVRSARSYFLDIASEYGDYPLYTHVGGSNCSAPKDPVSGRQSGPCSTDRRAQAIEQIGDYGWTNKGSWSDLNQFSLSYKICRREAERTGQIRDTEHTMYCSSEALWQEAESRGLTNLTAATKNSWDKNYKSWSFDLKEKSSPASSSIKFDFWSGYPEYAVDWRYDPASNSYFRHNGGQEQSDFNNQQKISAKNIIVQFAKESRSVDEHFHNLYQVIGNGKGYLFQNGDKKDITWSKANRTSRTIYKDSSGKEINFLPGIVWVEILPTGNPVVYEG